MRFPAFHLPPIDKVWRATSISPAYTSGLYLHTLSRQNLYVVLRRRILPSLGLPYNKRHRPDISDIQQLPTLKQPDFSNHSNYTPMPRPPRHCRHPRSTRPLHGTALVTPIRQSLSDSRRKALLRAETGGLVIVWSVRKFRPYLEFHHFHVSRIIHHCTGC